jgi:Sulfotransferase domain
MRVTFVVCPSYHGATLLALLLNNHSRVSALGDTLPMRDLDAICACGQPVSACEFWQEVSAQLDTSRFAGLPTLLPLLPWPLAKHPVESSVLPVSNNPRLNRLAGRTARASVDLGAPIAWRLRRHAKEDFVATYRSFYELVLGLHGTTMFVDGSKHWRKVALLADELRAEAEIRIVHLVRDPRGFAASRRRHADGDDLRESGWLWADLHERMEGLREHGPYRLLRYEDLCVRPEAEMDELMRFLDLAPEPVVSAPRYPHKNHIIGNQMLRTFSGAVTLDERWRTALSTEEQRLVLSCGGALARRLGYADDDRAVEPERPERTSVAG